MALLEEPFCFAWNPMMTGVTDQIVDLSKYTCSHPWANGVDCSWSTAQYWSSVPEFGKCIEAWPHAKYENTSLNCQQQQPVGNMVINPPDVTAVIFFVATWKGVPKCLPSLFVTQDIDNNYNFYLAVSTNWKFCDGFRSK